MVRMSYQGKRQCSIDKYFLKINIVEVGTIVSISLGFRATLMVQRLPITLRIAAKAAAQSKQQRFYLSENKWYQYDEMHQWRRYTFFHLDDDNLNYVSLEDEITGQ